MRKQQLQSGKLSLRADLHHPTPNGFGLAKLRTLGFRCPNLIHQHDHLWNYNNQKLLFMEERSSTTSFFELNCADGKDIPH